MDLTFESRIAWQNTGREGEGTAKLGGQELQFSAPYSMGGKGTGTSPEELLLTAVGSCYSGTLFALLMKEHLRVTSVDVQVTGKVTEYPIQAKFSQLVVNPTIVGADSSQVSLYEEAANKAREKCFIGKTIAGNVEYLVGTVTVEA